MVEPVTCPSDPWLICLNKTEAETISVTPAEETISVGEIVILVAAVLGYVLVFVFTRRYKKRQSIEETKSRVSEQAQNFSVDLLKYCVPTTSAGGYHFRGMKPRKNGIELEFDRLGLHLHGSGKCVLEGVCGYFRAGQMAAVMGPSGAGKTTFMNVLCGKASYGSVKGTVRINGRECSIKEVRPVMGFVPQDDVVHEELTVREQIFYSAQLRNPAGTSRSRIDRIVEDVLAVMQLGRIQNSIVGSVENRGISGGQRKRVNIGLELAACPMVLFLDEPTSGLDATTSLGIVSCLKKLTELGMTVVMSIHQPRYSLFTLFNEVLLLGVGGRTVYLGPSGAALPYFRSLGFRIPDNENPADWLMDVISGSVKSDKLQHFKAPMLFDLWEKQGTAVVSAHQPLARTMTEEDAKVVRTTSLSAKWESLDAERTGFITKAQLLAILTESQQGEAPPPEVVDEIFHRMGGSGSQISKDKFTAYLLGLEKGFAADAETTPLLRTTQAESSDSDAVDSGSDPEAYVDGSECGIDLTRPRLFTQFHVLLHRNMIRWVRKVKSKILNVLLVVFAALVFGSQSKDKVSLDQFMMSFKINLSHVAVGLMVAITCLDVFGSDRPIFWRESASGISRLAFFFSRVIVTGLDVWLLAFAYSVTWYLSASPSDSFWLYNECFRMLAINAAGYGFLISTLVAPANSTLAVSVVVLVMGGAVGEPQSIQEGVGTGAEKVPQLSPFTWAAGWNYLRLVDLHGGPKAVVLQGRQIENGYRTVLGDHYATKAPMVLTMYACVLLVASYLCLRFRHRDKQV
eukprot:TRINITY_DN12365_c0_g2_i1.p1 TRINITY_DN12365_c0_g2~~TRINITY_DN12365_c0_g2_i1.p1  ORF type:complete len:798 (-),score=143.32 TRINITY_DN12365_c0_g2_i1:123-2516(-)